MSMFTMNMDPLAFIVVIVIFLVTKDMVVMVLCLLIISIVLPVMFMGIYKVYWPCGLLLILLSTGLLVVFTYIVSLQEGVQIKGDLKTIFLSFVILSLSISLLVEPSSGIHSLQFKVAGDLMTSTMLIFALLALVIMYMRLIYSKGGGFRKKF